MSAGFSFSGKVYWTTNGLVEALVGALTDEAEKLIGRDDPLTIYFRESFQGYYSGFIAFLDEWAGDAKSKEHLLLVMDAAAGELLRRRVLTDDGDSWLNTEFRQLRDSVAIDQSAEYLAVNVDLHKGLFIENQGFLIPWDITNEEAWRTGCPTAWNLPDDKLRMKWDGAVVLGGLECIVQTWFPTDRSRLSSFNIMDAHHDEHPADVWADILKAHCRRLFGEGKGQQSWQYGNVTINLCHNVRFVEAYSLSITRRQKR